MSMTNRKSQRMMGVMDMSVQKSPDISDADRTTVYRFYNICISVIYGSKVDLLP